MLAATAQFANPWRYQAHPEVWLLVASLVGLYVYVIRVVGPKAVTDGGVIATRRNIGCFTAGILMLWLASDWPVHDIGEGYLYSVHMFQHMVLSYFMPPLMLLATPTWFLRILVGKGHAYRVLKFMAKPVVAGVVFNGMVMITHVPGVVNTSVNIAWLHYLLHSLIVLAALIMWMPVCGPFRELRIGYGAQMIYLFLQSVVPTVPAGWLTFAEGVVYKHYDIPVRVWGLSATHDQQLAGVIMKIGGGFFLWTIVIVLFFRRFSFRFSQDNDGTYRRSTADSELPVAGSSSLAPPTAGDTPLTYEQVFRVFETVPPAPEPEP